MSEHDGLVVETITNGPFMENCFLISHQGSGILVDPGDEEQTILARVRELELELTEIVCTHAHIDHAGAVAPLKRVLGVPFSCHADELPALKHMPNQAALFGLGSREVPEIDRQLAAGDAVQVGQLQGKVLHTPGHSAGGICLLFAEQKVVLVGDTLFAGSVGRTDLPGGSTQTLLDSINEQLLTLDDDVVVHCGHGPATTIGAERRGNPFLQPGGMGMF